MYMLLMHQINAVNHSLTYNAFMDIVVSTNTSVIIEGKAMHQSRTQI